MKRLVKEDLLKNTSIVRKDKNDKILYIELIARVISSDVTTFKYLGTKDLIAMKSLGKPINELSNNHKWSQLGSHVINHIVNVLITKSSFSCLDVIQNSSVILYPFIIIPHGFILNII